MIIHIYIYVLYYIYILLYIYIYIIIYNIYIYNTIYVLHVLTVSICSVLVVMRFDLDLEAIDCAFVAFGHDCLASQSGSIAPRVCCPKKD